MSVLFEATATKIGELVSKFAKEKLLILFDENAPEELHDITVLHTDRKNAGEITPKDVLVIDGQSFQISFVGDTANKTMQEMGHVTIKFDGGQGDLPGTICVEDKPVPNVQVGSKIQFIRHD
ncbi:PTS glucitol/sorbitol transporter subunit IIA [Shimazuella sp. AN120528]|uniref:PTS glucitol/sorbitol transporter subunit IIA n=1 Tax=Shimazuella soli TaxID=1892854 RepID=UPI001F0D1675|nr:PTS glucitol/sorbitol transporter subunit IIA [Shimazuella soli]MCH5584679.1 PTS glucitol/sorbitol transporter subunit IIA [Shimazuella soli]